MRVPETDQSQNVIRVEEYSKGVLKKSDQKIELLNILNKEEKNEIQLLDKEQLEEYINELNHTVDALHKDLHFKVHDGSGRMMVEIVDVDKDEVIKEIPPKEVLDMIGRIKDMVGLIIDEKI